MARKKQKINVAVIYNPFKTTEVERNELVYNRKWKLDKYLSDLPEEAEWVISLDGKIIEKENWSITVVKPESNLSLALVPQGGGGDGEGKNILRMVAIIAISALVLSPAGAAAIGSALGTTSATAIAVAQATIAVAGTLLVNALIPPPDLTSKDKSKPSYGIDGAKNTSKEGAVVPVIYGRHRVAGNIVDLFTKNVGTDQYLYMRTVLNDGRVSAISDIQINDEPIANYKDVEYRVALGDDNGTSNDWFGEAITLINKNRKIDTTGVVHTTLNSVERIRLDLLFPEGIGRRKPKDGYIFEKTIDFLVEYKSTASSTWLPLPAKNVINVASMSSSAGYLSGSSIVNPNAYSYSGQNYYDYYDYTDENPSNLVLSDDVDMYAYDASIITSTNTTNSAPDNAVIIKSQTGLSRLNISALAIITSNANTPLDGNYGVNISYRKVGDTTWITALNESGVVAKTGIQNAFPSITKTAVITPNPAFQYEIKFEGCTPTSVTGESTTATSVTIPTTVSLNAFNFKTAVSGTSQTYQGLLSVTRASSSPVRYTFESTAIPVGNYDVRIRRVTAEDPDVNILDQAYLSDVGEIKLTNIAYVGTANISLKIKLTDQLSSVPNLTALVDGSIVKKYDRDGNVTDSNYYTRYPAYQAADILLNQERGNSLSNINVDFASLAACEEYQIANDLQFNGVFESDSNVYEAMGIICRAGRMSPVLIGNKYTFILDKPSEPEMIFNESNIIDGTFSQSWLGIQERANEIQYTYYPEDEDFKSATIRMVDPATGNNSAIRTAEITGIGVTNLAQAKKETEKQLLENRLIKKTCSFDAPIESIALSIGDVALVQHTAANYGDGVGSGRIKAGSTTSLLKLDAPITLDPLKNYRALLTIPSYKRYTVSITSIAGSNVFVTGLPATLGRCRRLVQNGVDLPIYNITEQGSTDKIMIDGATTGLTTGSADIYDTDVVEERDVVYQAGELTEVSITPALSSPPPEHSIYLVGAVEVLKKKYRLVGVSGEDLETRSLSFIEYNEGVYGSIDAPLVIPPAENKLCPQVTGLSLSTPSQLNDNTTSVRVTTEWQVSDVNYEGVDVYAKINSSDWKFIRTLYNVRSLEQTFNRYDSVEVKVVAFNKFGYKANFYDAPVSALFVDFNTNISADWSNISGTGKPQDNADVTATSAAFLAALDAISTAQDTADGKIETFYQSSMPTTGTIGDLWFDTDDGNKLYRHNGSTFVVAQDTKIGDAINAATLAQDTADGKVTTYFSTSAPTPTAIGDLWYNSSTGQLQRWNGSIWTLVSDVTATSAAMIAAQQRINDILNDGVITAGQEKQKLITELNSFYQVYLRLYNSAVTVGVDPAPVVNAWNAYYAYIVGLPNYNNVNVDTAISYASYENHYRTFKDAYALVEGNVAYKTSTTATWDGTNGKPTNILVPQLRNLNAGFDNWTGTALDNWDDWSWGTTISSKVADPNGGYALRMNSTQSSQINAGIQQVALNAFPPNSYIVLEMEVEKASGSYIGTGGLFSFYNDAVAYVASVAIRPDLEKDSNGNLIGAGDGKRYSFSRTVKAPPTATGLTIYGMNNWEVFSTSAPVKDIKWHKLGWRPATDGEIKAYEATQELLNIGSDSIVSKDEKPEVNRKWNEIYNIAVSSSFTSDVDALGIDRTAFNNAYYAVAAMVSANSDALITFGTDTPIADRNVFNYTFNTFYTEYAKLCGKLGNNPKLGTIETGADVTATSAAMIAAQQRINDILNDGVITAGQEKQKLITELNSFYQVYLRLYNSAVTVGVDPAPVVNAWNAYYAYIVGLPNYNNVNVDTAISYASYENHYRTFKDAYALVEGNVAYKTSTTATWDGTNGKPTNILVPQLRNLNAGFDNWTGTALDNWDDWSWGTTISSKVADPNGGYALRMNSTQSSQINAGIQQVALNAFPPNSYIVLEMEVEKASGSYIGTGGLFSFYNDAVAYVASVAIRPDLEKDSNGNLIGAGDGKRYSFSRTVKAPPTATGLTIYGMNNWEVFSTSAPVKDIKWHKLGWRPATDGEIKAYEATQELLNIGSDSILSKGEKPNVKRLRGEIAVLYDRIVGSASEVGVNYDILATALTNLDNYLASLTTPTAWNDTSGDTNIVSADFAYWFNNYYYWHGEIEKRINKKANDEIVAAQLAIAAISADNIVSKDEKPEVNRKWNEIYNIAVSSSFTSDVDALGIDRTAFNNAYYAVAAMVSANSDALITFGTDTPIADRNVFNYTFNTFYTEYAKLCGKLGNNPKLGTIETGADVTANAQIDVTGLASLVFDFTDGVLSSSMPKTLQLTAKRGNTDITASGAWSIFSSTNCTVSVGSNTGLVSVSGITGAGKIVVKFVYGTVEKYFEIANTINSITTPSSAQYTTKQIVDIIYGDIGQAGAFVQIGIINFTDIGTGLFEVFGGMSVESFSAPISSTLYLELKVDGVVKATDTTSIGLGSFEQTPIDLSVLFDSFNADYAANAITSNGNHNLSIHATTNGGFEGLLFSNGTFGAIAWKS